MAPLEDVQHIFSLQCATGIGRSLDVGVFHLLDGVTFYEMQALYGRLGHGANASGGGVGAERDEEAAGEQDDDDESD